MNMAEFSARVHGKPVGESVDHPAHYTFGKIEVIDAIEDWDLPYHLGNVVKYVARHMHKNAPLEDLEKAQWYLDRYIQLLKDRQPKCLPTKPPH